MESSPFQTNGFMMNSKVVKYSGGLQNTIRCGALSFAFNFMFVKQTGYNYFKDFSNIAPGAAQIGNFPTFVMERWRSKRI